MLKVRLLKGGEDLLAERIIVQRDGGDDLVEVLRVNLLIHPSN